MRPDVALGPLGVQKGIMFVTLPTPIMRPELVVRVFGYLNRDYRNVG